MRSPSAVPLAGPHLPRGPATLFLSQFSEAEFNVFEYLEGEFAFHENDEARSLHVVMKGRFGLFGTARLDRTFLGLASQGEILDPATIFAPRHTVAAEALETCRLATIPSCHLLARFSRNNASLAFVAEQLARRNQALERHILWCRVPAHVHLARLLLDLSSAKNNEAVVVLPFSRALLAGWFGIQPESLCRAFTKLRPYGVSTRGPTVRILDRRALATIAA